MDKYINLLLTIYLNKNLVKVALRLDRDSTKDEVIAYFKEKENHDFLMSFMPHYIKNTGEILDIEIINEIIR